MSPGQLGLHLGRRWEGSTEAGRTLGWLLTEVGEMESAEMEGLRGSSWRERWSTPQEGSRPPRTLQWGGECETGVQGAFCLL